jgi:hypothetical protein
MYLYKHYLLTSNVTSSGVDDWGLIPDRGTITPSLLLMG